MKENLSLSRLCKQENNDLTSLKDHSDNLYAKSSIEKNRKECS